MPCPYTKQNPYTQKTPYSAIEGDKNYLLIDSNDFLLIDEDSRLLLDSPEIASPFAQKTPYTNQENYEPVC